MSQPSTLDPSRVLPVSALQAAAVEQLLGAYELQVTWLAEDAEIPGSHWGAPEAGIIERRIYLRPDTPVHSMLHEAAHVICMDAQRRENLHTDAGGDDLEECGVCYLQLLLGAQLPGYSLDRQLEDMDHWGYSYRLGSARAWFEQDAEDARQWLLEQQLIDTQNRPLMRLR